MSKPLRIIYAGTPDFSVPALEALIQSSHEVIAVYTQPDRPAGRGRGFKASPVKEKALDNNIPVFQPESLKTDDAQRQVTALAADLMVVTAYGLILPPAVLEAPRLGCINIHASLLPRWRGAAPIQRAILAGDKKTGITIMQMDAGLDTGDMLAVTECEISASDTGSTLHDKLMRLGANTLLAMLPEFSQQMQGVRQNDELACYANKLSKAEARINWADSAENIARRVRAYNAWPVAYTTYQKPNKAAALKLANKSAKLRIWQAEVSEKPVSSDISAAPGTVIAESAQAIDVITGDGILRIMQLQPEGKRNMPVADFLNANSLLQQRLGDAP